MIHLEDRTALVTGAGRGIGRAIATSLAEAGANVVVGDIIDEREQTASTINDQGGDAIAADMDVTDREAVERAVERGVDSFGSIDILVNNAGVFPMQDLDSMTTEDWQWVIDVNLTGAWHCTQAVLPGMRDAEYGRIVNIASIAGGQIGWGPELSHYAASKGGMVGFTKSAAIGLGADGITINAILPGFIRTEAAEEASAEDLEAVIAATPVGRGGKPEEIGFLVAALSSEHAGFLTGASIVVDGGYTLV